MILTVKSENPVINLVTFLCNLLVQKGKVLKGIFQLVYEN